MRKTIAILAILTMTLGSLELAFARGGGSRNGGGAARSGASSRSRRGNKKKDKDAKRNRERTACENRDGLLRDVRRDDS